MSGNGDGSEDNGHDPAHGRRGRSRHRFGRPDRHALLARLPVVVAIGAAVAAGVAFDGARQGASHEQDARTDAPAALAAMPQSPPAARGAATWYCVAGPSARGAAGHTVVVQNAGDEVADVTLTIYGGDLLEGDAPSVPPAVDEVRVPAGRTTEVSLGDRVGTPLSAALVEVDGGDVAVEHRVEGRHGADAGACASATSPTWHLAWSSTARDARDLVVLFNPFPTSAVVDARFATEDRPREPVRYQGLPVPPESVVAVDVGEDVTAADDVSATFDVRSGRVVVERMQVLDGSFGIEGLTLEPGVPAPAPTWVFADGEASAAGLGPPDPETGERPRADAGADDGDGTGDESSPPDPRDDGDATVTTERIVVYNPGDARAEVDVRVVPASDADDVVAPPPPFALTVNPGRFVVVDYGEHDRVEPGVPHATIVASTNGQPVVAERVTVDEGPAGGGGDGDPVRPGEITASPGAPGAATAWRLPAGGALVQGGRTDLVVFNPGTEAATVEVHPASAVDEASYTVAQGARLAIPLRGGDEQGIEVVADTPVVVERAIRAADGRRVSTGPAVPSADGAVPL